MFSPHHRFANCARLEAAFQRLRAAGSVPDDIVLGFNRYHYALIHKLKSARYHVDALTETLSSTPPLDSLSQSSDFMFKVNMHLDGFFYSGGSALDILARELLTYYGVTLPAKVYYHTAHATLSTSYPTDPILDRIKDPQWKEDFTTYRNALTHELMIAGQFNINVRLDGASEEKTLVLPLPDDPRVDPSARTTRKYPDADEYCRNHIRRLLTLINTIYGDIITRMGTNNALPL